jgi:hypothetical protein
MQSPIPLITPTGKATSLFETLKRALAAPTAWKWISVLAMVLMLPTVSVGLLGDDFLFRELIQQPGSRPHPGALFGLYDFADGMASHTRQAREIGLYPWWVSDDAKMNFWRPLSELTHWLDFTMWPHWPALMHLHSVLWYGLLVFLLGKLYRELDPNATRASVSTLVFAVSTMHLLSVAWLAARNQLIAACFILLCLSLHHAWRRRGDVASRWGAWLCFGLGLLSAEAGLAAMAYLVAYALFMDGDRGWRNRAMSLLPYLVTVVIWRHQYNVWGYGSAGSGGYIDPGHDTWRFAEAMALRLPTLLLAALSGVSSTVLQSFPPALKPAYALGATLLLLWMGRVSWRLGIWRSDVLKFLAAGAVLSLVPVCAAEPNDRLLLNAELGLSAVLGTLFAKGLAVSFRSWGKGIRGARALMLALMIAHLLIFPVATVVLASTLSHITAVPSYDEPMSLPDVPVASGRHVLLLNPPKAVFVGYYQTVRRFHGLENGLSMQALASGDQDLDLEVLDAHRLRIHASKGFGEDLTRDLLRQPLRTGELVGAGVFSAKVLSVKPDGRGDTVELRFDRALNDPSLAFFVWSDNGYVPFQVPEAGAPVLHFKPSTVRKLMSRRFGMG